MEWIEAVARPVALTGYGFIIGWFAARQRRNDRLFWVATVVTTVATLLR
jgi:hypothetical protein